LNHDYTEEDEINEFKVSLFHLIHLLQCNHGSETIQQILNNEELRNARKINSSFTYVPARCRGEPYVRPSYIGTKALLVRGRTQGSPLDRAGT